MLEEALVFALLDSSSLGLDAVAEVDALAKLGAGVGVGAVADVWVEGVTVFAMIGAVFFTTSDAVAKEVPTAFMPLSTLLLALEMI